MSVCTRSLKSLKIPLDLLVFSQVLGFFGWSVFLCFFWISLHYVQSSELLPLHHSLQVNYLHRPDGKIQTEWGVISWHQEFTCCTRLGVSIRERFSHLLRAAVSYKGRHDCGGVAESLDGSIRPLLEVVVVARHVEGWKGWPATLHGSSQSSGRQRHAQPAVGRQGALDRVGQRGGAGAHGRQRLWVLEAWEARGGGDPGAQREVVWGGESRACRR